MVEINVDDPGELKTLLSSPLKDTTLLCAAGMDHELPVWLDGHRNVVITGGRLVAPTDGTTYMQIINCCRLSFQNCTLALTGPESWFVVQTDKVDFQSCIFEAGTRVQSGFGGSVWITNCTVQTELRSRNGGHFRLAGGDQALVDIGEGGKLSYKGMPIVQVLTVAGSQVWPVDEGSMLVGPMLTGLKLRSNDLDLSLGT